MSSDNYIDRLPRDIRELVAAYATDADTRARLKKLEKRRKAAARAQRRFLERAEELASLGYTSEMIDRKTKRLRATAVKRTRKHVKPEPFAKVIEKKAAVREGRVGKRV